MNNNSCGSDMVIPKTFEGVTESTGDAALPAIVVLPVSWASGIFCQTPIDAQHVLYLLACQQAEVVVRAVHRRRQLLFAQGVHLWN
jgi:hypothetical protein